MHKHNNTGRTVMMLSAAALFAMMFSSPAVAGFSFGGFGGAFFGHMRASLPPAAAQAPAAQAHAMPVDVHALPPAREAQSAKPEVKIDYQPLGGAGLISDDLGKLGAKASP